MGQIALSKGHEKTNSMNSRHVKRQRFQLLVMQKIHLFGADLRKVINAFDFHRLCFHPVTIFPIAAFCRNFADINFGIKVSRKRIAVIAGIAVQNINIVNFIKLMLESIGRKNAGDAGIKSTAQKSGNSGIFKFFAVGPLPAVFEFCGILGFIVCSIHIVCFSGKTSVHNF